MALPEINIPFEQLGRQLADTLDIGGALNHNVGNVPEAATSMVLESMGSDLLIFLTASVIVTPLCTFLGVTPILGYLLAGALLGSHGMDMFSNSKADVELGDFGILFLLFSEGLEVSTNRLKKLTNYLPLGLAQISLTAAVLSAAILFGAPQAERFMPALDAGIIDVTNPIEALVLALAGTLSTSAFVFPVLKEREWEEEPAGQAATSILLLQDLLVAPLLVLMPYVVGQDVTDYSAIGFLTAKATIGFGSVVAVGSFALRRLFKLVAQARSTETFVALCLLVSVGMGAIAKSLGLTDTVGAFAAGVLLANTNYRAQIQADILPFKGILLGIFFMGAGTSFDLDLVMAELPTIVTAVLALISLKAVTLLVATRVPRWIEPNRLDAADGVRVALLLAGGGEFAFVVLALAERLEVLPKELGGLLTAVVLITMAVTPFLGSVAEIVSESLSGDGERTAIDVDAKSIEIASNAIVVCGYEESGKATLKVLSTEYGKMTMTNPDALSQPRIVAFDVDPSLADTILLPSSDTAVLFGDGANPEVIRNSGVIEPTAIFVTYQDHGQVVAATSRMRIAFRDAPIYTRANTRDEAQTLQAAGATEVIVELDKLSRSAVPLMRDELSRSAVELLRTEPMVSEPAELRQAVALAAGISSDEVEGILEIFSCIDQNESGDVDADELTKMLRRANTGIASDDELDQMEAWIRTVVQGDLDSIQFCRVYVNAPSFIKNAFNDGCKTIIKG
jgi:Kef-type K+ transport system membrane component KefB